jgi:hypothetical protein
VEGDSLDQCGAAAGPGQTPFSGPSPHGPGGRGLGRGSGCSSCAVLALVFTPQPQFTLEEQAGKMPADAGVK